MKREMWSKEKYENEYYNKTFIQETKDKSIFICNSMSKFSAIIVEAGVSLCAQRRKGKVLRVKTITRALRHPPVKKVNLMSLSNNIWYY